MSNETTPRRSSEDLDPAGLRASIVKALFHNKSPSTTPPSRIADAMKVCTTTAKVSSPGKKPADLSLSEGDLTITDEARTPIARTTSQKIFPPNDVSERSLAADSMGKEKVTKCIRKPRELRSTTSSNCSSTRGPNTEQLAWLKACRKGDVTTCEKLLNNNPDLLHYVPPLYLNYSAVHIATLGRHYELLRLLREKGANFNATTKFGYSPLHLAAQNQDKETVRRLIWEFGVDEKSHDLLGYTYEHYADWLDYPEYEETNYPLTNCDARSRSSSRYSRQPSVESLESLASSKSLSRNGSVRETLKGLLNIPTAIAFKSRSSSLNQLAM